MLGSWSYIGFLDCRGGSGFLPRIEDALTQGVGSCLYRPVGCTRALGSNRLESTAKMKTVRRWRTDLRRKLTSATQLGWSACVNARWALPLVARLLVFSKIFLTWDLGGMWFLVRHMDHLGLFSCLIPAKHIFTKTHGIMSV
jgi:hypothetical protein